MHRRCARCSPAAHRRRESCLAKQLQQLAARATCQAPWVTTANLRVALNPAKLRLPKRASIVVNFTNPLAIADLIVHGNAATHGWGQDIQPDQNLLFVRGFDPVTKQFKYSVNDRFGSTRPQQSASRSAAFVSINVIYDIGFTRERQVLTQRLDVGRAPPGHQTKRAISQGVRDDVHTESDVDDSPAAGFIEAHAESRRIVSRRSAPSSRGMPIRSGRRRRRFSRLSPRATAMARRTGNMWWRVKQTVDYLITLVPNVRGLVTPEQKRKLPNLILNYLDDRVLKFLRSSTAGDGGNFFIR